MQLSDYLMYPEDEELDLDMVPVTLQDYIDVGNQAKASATSPGSKPSKTSETTKIDFASIGLPPPPNLSSPEKRKGMQTALQKYMEMADKAASTESAGITQLEQYFRDIQQQPQEIDWTPLAAVIQSMRPQSKLLSVAQAMAPQTEEQRNMQLMKLQDMIQQRKGALTGRELEAAKMGMQQQIEADKAERDAVSTYHKLLMELMRTKTFAERNKVQEKIAKMNAELQSKREAQRADRAADRQQEGIADKKQARLESNLIKFEQKAIDAVPLVENLSVIEDLLGAPLEQYDPKTGTLGGKKIDLPGKSIPGIGRGYLPGSTGETLQTAFSNIFNTTLKDRSGAAVTDQELRRLQSEFAQGKFNTEEKMVEALQRYKSILRKRMRQHEAAFAPEVRQTYKTQGGMLSEDLLPEPGAAKSPPPPSPKPLKGGERFKAGEAPWEVGQ